MATKKTPVKTDTVATQPKKTEAALYFVVSEQIDDNTLADIEKKVGKSKADILYLVIQSPGGSPFSAVGIMNLLDTHFGEIKAIIPRDASSAATLMALGTNEIYMQERSALGPLDLPIEHHRDGSRISALDVINTTTSMATLVEAIATDRYKFLRDKKTSSKHEAAKLALESATDFLKPIVEQVDPYHLQKAHRELRIGMWYAMDLLLKRMMPGDVTKAYETARKLVHDFPAHEYSIYQNDAEHLLNLTVKKLSDLPIWSGTLEQRYSKICNKPYCVEFSLL